VYVALTRAKFANYLLFPPTNGKKRIRQSPALWLRHALGINGDTVGPAKLLERGDPQWREQLPAGEVARTEGSWAAPKPFRFKPNRMLKVVTGTSRKVSIQIPSSKQRKHSGDVAHEELSKVVWIDEVAQPSAKRPKAKGSGKQMGLFETSPVTAPEVTEYAESAGGFFEHAAIAAVFRRSSFPDAERVSVWRERAFSAMEGDTLLSGRFDRVVVGWKGDSPIWAKVYDFKHSAQSAAQARELYRPQLDHYRRALEVMCGLEKSQIETYIVLLKSGEVVNV
jgi:hypothetical protein